MLIDGGADVNIADSNGQTPLHQGCYDIDGSIVTMLINSGADVNVAKGDGWTPLHEACNQVNTYRRREVSLEIMRVLILAGADTQVRDSEGRLPVDMLRAEDPRSRAIYEEAVVEEEENQALRPVLK
jgi:ankyrin repeat protein